MHWRAKAVKVINLFGGPGSGKSTTAAGLFYVMKRQGLKVELVTEYAKDLVWSNRLDEMMDQQEYIFAKQNNRIHRLRKKVDYVITDSPVFLSRIYPEINSTQGRTSEWPALKEFYALVEKVWKTYDNANFFLRRPKHFEEVGRVHSKDQSEEIDLAIIHALRETNTPYDVVPVGNHTVTRIYKLLNLPPIVGADQLL